MLGTSHLLGRECQDRLDGRSAGDLDHLIDSHFGFGDQFHHRQQELSLLAQEFCKLPTIGLVCDLVRCLMHGYSFLNNR
jgi:hypothetical protein